MLVSIITINYNNAKGLERTFHSVFNQTNKDFEYIVIDGNSTDGSKNIILQNESKIGYSISEPDKGIYDAMNKGIAKAKGDYILFLNSGDYLLDPNTIENVKSELHTFDVISGDLILEEKNQTKHYLKSIDEIEISHFLNISLYHQATFISKKMFEVYGLYDETFKLGGDYEFFIRIFFKFNATYKHINKPISYFVADGISNNPLYSEINKSERQKSWKQNVSDRTLNIFNDYTAVRKSNVYWLYIKENNSNFYHFILKSIYKTRSYLYKILNRNK